MGEQTRTIILLIVAIIGIPTSIFGLIKVYIEYRKEKKGNNEKSGMNNDNHVSITINNSNVDKLNQKDDSIILKDEYISVFAEKGRIHHEKIKIENLENEKIKGEVFWTKIIYIV